MTNKIADNFIDDQKIIEDELKADEKNKVAEDFIVKKFVDKGLTNQDLKDDKKGGNEFELKKVDYDTIEEDEPEKTTAAKSLSKKELIRDLRNELLILGLNEGNAVECSNMTRTNSAHDVTCQGVLRKQIKEGLILEYTFSSPEGGVKNINLNNVPIELEDVEEEKLVKLLVVAKSFNKLHKEKVEIEQSIYLKQQQEKQKAQKEADKNRERSVLEIL